MNQATVASSIASVMDRALATGLFVSLCTITALPTPLVLGPSGSPTDAYVPVTGMIDIRCMRSVNNPNQSPIDNERASTGAVETVAEWHVLLEAYYPLITTAMRAVIDGITYDILTVQPSSQGVMTRMRVRVASI